MKKQGLFFILYSLLLLSAGFLLGQLFVFSRGIYSWETIPWNSQDYFTSSPVNGEMALLESGEGVVLDSPEREGNGTEQERIDFPSHVGNFYMDKIVLGEEALSYAQKIHGSEAPIKRVFIPYYSNMKEQVIIWVFELESLKEAIRHMERINDRLQKSQQYEEPESFFLQNVEVHYVQGMNLDNYYYRKGHVIYWVSIIAEDPIPLFLKFYDYF